MPVNYVPPQFHLDGFNCPSCGAFAHQEWRALRTPQSASSLKDIELCFCRRCDQRSYWHMGIMLFPTESPVPPPRNEMPPAAISIYNEARDIVVKSPRAAVALLRLAAEILMAELVEGDKTLDDAIRSLVSKGLPQRIQQALDSIRVIGNNAVHPGQIDIRDDIGTATVLFEMLNIICEYMIVHPKKIEEIYGMLPETVKGEIERKDGNP